MILGGQDEDSGGIGWHVLVSNYLKMGDRECVARGWWKDGQEAEAVGGEFVDPSVFEYCGVQ